MMPSWWSSTEARRPLPGDVRALAAVRCACDQGYEILWARSTDGRILQLQAFLGDCLAGSVTGTGGDWGQALCLESIEVMPAYQQKGLGTALVVAAARLSGCRRLTYTPLIDSRARRLMAKCRPILHADGVEAPLEEAWR